MNALDIVFAALWHAATLWTPLLPAAVVIVACVRPWRWVG